MKIIIDIPEETYNFIKENSSGSTAHEAIKNGTPLPKGHGRLIDADALLEQFRDGTEGFDGVTYTRYDIGNIIDLENTIIEAEKEDEPPKRIICPNCKSDRICWACDYGHEGAIVQEYTCKNCGARIECYVGGESENDSALPF